MIRASVLLTAATIAISSRKDAPRALVRGDLDGDGAVETASARLTSGRARLEVKKGRGAPRTEASAPAPEGPGRSVSLTLGELGSAGALLEVVASGPRLECRSLWRFRAGTLERIPVLERAGRPLPDCEPAGAWSYRWKGAAGRPSLYVRERSRRSAAGLHHQIDAFTFSGFSMDLDGSLSSAEIDGVAIPEWHDAVLYPRAALDELYSRSDLSALRSAPKLEVEADRSEGVFALRWLAPPGLRARVVQSVSGRPGELTLALSAEGSSGEARVVLAREGVVPSEVRVVGFGPPRDGTYFPIARARGGALLLFSNAEDEISSEHLPGRWVDERGGEVAVSVTPALPFVLRFGEDEVRASIERAPEGTDLLLVPRDGSAPRWALGLRGPNNLARVPVACATDGDCAPRGKADVLRRAGVRVNVP